MDALELARAAAEPDPDPQAIAAGMSIPEAAAPPDAPMLDVPAPEAGLHDMADAPVPPMVDGAASAAAAMQATGAVATTTTEVVAVTEALVETVAVETMPPPPPPPAGEATLAVVGTTLADGAADGPVKKKARRKHPINEAAHLTAEEARAAAEAEGLTLIESHSTVTGFLYVYLWGPSAAKKERESMGSARDSIGSVGNAATSSDVAAAVDAATAAVDAATASGEGGGAAAAEATTTAELVAKLEGEGEGAAGAAASSSAPALVPSTSALAMVNAKATRRFQLYPQAGIHKDESLGYFRTAEGAALAYSRILGPEKSKEVAEKVRARHTGNKYGGPVREALLNELKDVTAEEALKMAADEGLALVRSRRSKSGYKHVCAYDPGRYPSANARRFRLIAQNGVTTVEGNFRSAEGAALAHSRQIGADAARDEAAREEDGPVPVPQGTRRTSSGGASEGANSPAGGSSGGGGAGGGTSGGGSSSTYSRSLPVGDVRMLDAAAAIKMAEEEGLKEAFEALRSAANKSGFKNVSHHNESTKKSRPYQLKRPRPGSAKLKGGRKRPDQMSLGYFASAEAAALVQARIVTNEELEKANGGGAGSSSAAAAAATAALTTVDAEAVGVEVEAVDASVVLEPAAVDAAGADDGAVDTATNTAAIPVSAEATTTEAVAATVEEVAEAMVVDS